MSTEEGWLSTIVTQARWEADGVMSLTLAASGGAALPEWQPGAHVDVRLPSGLVRQYSLCGHPAESTYTIAVLREKDGRGGSAEIHDTALVGRELRIRAPRNHFQLEAADRYLFLAGGIGITPVLAMVREAIDRGSSWTLHYGGRSASTMAFTGTLRSWADGDSLTIRASDQEGPLPLPDIVRNAAAGTAIYACGPAGMLRALRETVVSERPDLELRTEQFTAAPKPDTTDEADTADGAPNGPFEVELSRTGETVSVPPGTSILDAVRELRPDVLSSCEEGFCGTCETKVIAGTPIHQDSILGERERAKNTTMMICVGGCASGRLVLDL